MSNFSFFHSVFKRLVSQGRQKPFEDTVEKGEIAHNEQFLLFPQCLQKACFPGASKGVIIWEWVKCLHNNNPQFPDRNCQELAWHSCPAFE